MNSRKIKFAELALISLVWIVLLVIPVLFREDNNHPVWKSISNQLEILVPVMILFLLNRFLLVPLILFRRKPVLYILAISGMIALVAFGSYYYDTRITFSSDTRQPSEIREEPPPPPSREQDDTPQRQQQPSKRQPRPVPPFANVIILSLLVAGFDTGIRSGLRWIESENERVRLEKENILSQLGILRNQISPHFFMNTLNNIYSLIELDQGKSRQAVMKLSKLMRYLLYENKSGKVLLSREFDFIKNYVDLMKLRYAEEVEIRFSVPEIFLDTEIPVLLFISYLENAFKYGASYQNESIIETSFEIMDGQLLFTCHNTKNVFSDIHQNGGIGLQNSRQRLDLIYNDKYSLSVKDTDETFTVKLLIPLA